MLMVTGPWEWIFILAIVGIPIYFMWIILKKAGFSGAWAIFAAFPVTMIVLLGFLAFVDWPSTSNEMLKEDKVT